HSKSISDHSRVIDDHTQIIKNRLNNLDMQLKNVEKMCLHSPNILGYISDGQNRVGLIDKQGHIDYINNFNRHQKPYYIALRNVRQGLSSMMLPSVVEYINQLQHKNHELIGQIVDPTQTLSIGLIMRNFGQQYLILINPVPKLIDIPVLAMTLSSSPRITTMKQELFPATQKLSALTQDSGTKDSKITYQCPTGSLLSLYRGNKDWTETENQSSRAPANSTSLME